MRETDVPAAPVYATGLGGEEESSYNGITFDFEGQMSVTNSSLRNAIRRLHVNTGHASPADLARVIRTAGGSLQAIKCAKALRCVSCVKTQRHKLQRPSRIKPEDVQFNECVYIDLYEIPDAAGKSFWFCLMCDEATDFCTGYMIKGHDSQSLWEAVETQWLLWAGPPDRIRGDNERGLVSEDMLKKLSRAGIYWDPVAPKAPWQKGKVERKIEFTTELAKAVLKGLRRTLQRKEPD